MRRIFIECRQTGSHGSVAQNTLQSQARTTVMLVIPMMMMIVLIMMMTSVKMAIDRSSFILKLIAMIDHD